MRPLQQKIMGATGQEWKMNWTKVIAESYNTIWNGYFRQAIHLHKLDVESKKHQEIMVTNTLNLDAGGGFWMN